MNRRKAVLGIALVLAALAAGTGLFLGGSSFFWTPPFTTEITLPAKTTPSIARPSKKPTLPVPVRKPCNGKPGPIIYYANEESAAKYDHFGTPIDPRLNPLDEPRNPTPNVRQVVTTSWERFCHDPVLTRATVAAAFPDWKGLRRPFDWMAALDKLNTIDWSKAEMVYYTNTPTLWTMMMKHGKDAGTQPTTYITRAHHAGWYLQIELPNGDKLFTRTGCGSQPSVDIRRRGTHAVLKEIFATS